MAHITTKMIQELRKRTGVGVGKCKEALEKAQGSIEEAIANLRKAGMASAVKKEGRETSEGIIKVVEDDQVLALVEVNAETDFVVKNEKFQVFVANLAQEMCSSRPSSIEEFVQQKYSADPELTIDQYRASLIQILGENIQIRRMEIFPKKANTSLGIYSHAGGKMVSIVEVSGSAQEQDLAKSLAMHVVAESPEYLTPEEVPERVITHEKEIAQAQIHNKPPHVIEKILAGKLKAYFSQVCLTLQPFIKDTSLSVKEFVEKQAKEKGLSLQITQFLRWKVGA